MVRIVILTLILNLTNWQFGLSQNGMVAEKKAVIVLCDFSSSVDTIEARKKMHQHINRLFNLLGSNTSYYFYSVGNALEPLFQDSIRNNQRDNIETISRYMTLIRRDITKKQDGNSCLINCLNLASEKIRLLYRSEPFKKYNLVVLSDMLEACRENGKYLNLEAGQFQPSEAWLTKWDPAKMYYTNMPNLDVQLVLTSNVQINYEKLMRFWRNYFKKVGYKGEVGFGVDITNRF